MRLYQVKRLDASTVIVTGEVVGLWNCETFEFDWHEESFSTTYVSREELEGQPGGRRALLAWRAGDDSLAEAEKVASFNRLFNEDLRKHIERGDPNAEAMMRSESIAEKYTYLQTYCLDGRTFEEVQAHRRCKPQLKLVSDG